MLPAVLIALVLVGFAGIGVLWLGIRGRRVNDHPVCRQCRFDLSGVYPAAVTCPECGAGLKRDGSVRIGARRRVGWAVAAGVVMVLLPLPPVAVVTFAAFTGSDVNKYKPLGLLLWEAGIADRARSDAISGEVMNRLLAKSLSADQYQAVIERALDLQGNERAAWSEGWGDLVERAKLDGVLKPEQETRFARQAARLGVRSRPAVHAGQTLPVRIALDEARVAANTSRSVALSFMSAKVDGQPVERVPEEASAQPASPFRFSTLRLDTAEESNYLGTIPLQGSKPTGAAGMITFFGGMGGDPVLSLRLPEGLAPGKHRVEIELGVEDISAGGGMVSLTVSNGRMMNPGGAPSRTVTLAAEVEVVGDDTPLARPIAASDETTRQLAQALQPTELIVSAPAMGDDAVGARVTFDIKDLPTSVAYDVIVRSGDREWKLGTLDNSDRGRQAGLAGQFMSTGLTIAVGGSTRTSRRSGSSGDQREVSGAIGRPEAATADIVLRPSAKAAGETLNLTTYYDGEIVFRDVPIVQDMFADPNREIMRRMEELRANPLLKPPGTTRPARRGAG